MHKQALAVALCCLACAACVTREVGLDYPAQPVATAVIAAPTAPTVSAGTFVDQRGEDATWFGAIRGGYGNPLKILHANKPISITVQKAFADGLRERGFHASGGTKTYQVAGVIRTLDCSQYVRREAHAVIEVSVYDTSKGGSALFTRVYKADNLEGSLVSLKTGVFASVDDLRMLAEKTLDEVVDKALDDTALRNALQP